jgi:hypothetical protein
MRSRRLRRAADRRPLKAALKAELGPNLTRSMSLDGNVTEQAQLIQHLASAHHDGG